MIPSPVDNLSIKGCNPSTIRFFSPSMKVIIVHSLSGDAYFDIFSDTIKRIGRLHNDLIMVMSAVEFAEELYVGILNGDQEDDIAGEHIREICDIWDYTCDKTYTYITHNIEAYRAMATDVLVLYMNYDSFTNYSGRIKVYLQDKRIFNTTVYLHSCASPKDSSVIIADPSNKSTGYTKDYTLLYEPSTAEDIISLFYNQFMEYSNEDN